MYNLSLVPKLKIPSDSGALIDHVTRLLQAYGLNEAGEVIMSHVSGDLDDIADGTTYGKVLQTNLVSGDVDHGSIAGLSGDDHPQYIKDSEFTQDSGILVGTGAGAFAEETGATLRTSIGTYSTAETDSAIDTDIATHAAAADPHTGYLKESSLSDAQALDLTDAGDSALHYHATDRARANHTGIQAGTTVEVDELGTATYDDVQDFINTTMASGFVSGGTVTDSGSGEVDIAAGVGWIRADSSTISSLKAFDWVQQSNLALTDASMNYIYVDYNSGTPLVNTTIDVTGLDHTSQFVIALVYRDGNTVHITPAGQKLNHFAHKIYYYSWEQVGIQRAFGLVTSETGTRNIVVTAGVLYWALERIPLSEVDTSGAGTFSYFYRASPSGWTKVTSQTQINNANYDDGDGTLGALGSNRYGVHWVYQLTNGDICVVYGQGNYVLAQAEAATAPSSLPGVISASGVFIAKIIIQESAATFTNVKLPWLAQIGLSVATSHSDLANLSNDDHAQYIKDTEFTQDSGFLVGTGAGTFVEETGATLRTSIGTYSTAETDAAIDADISTHVGLADPHTGYVLESLFDAHTILQATADNTPLALTVTEQTLVGRITSGNIAALNIAQVRTLLSITNVEDTAHSTDAHTMTIDGRDVSTDGTKLDTIATSADVTGSNTPQAHKDSHDPQDGSDALDTAAAAEISVVVAAGGGSSHSLARADHIHAINHAITDNHIATIDGTTNAPVNLDYAKWTTLGLEGRTYAEVKTDLSLNNVENTVHSTDGHTMTIDGRDVSTDGTKLDTIETNADVTDFTNVAAALAAATGAVAFNSQNITTVGTVDGVDVSAIPTTYLPLAGGTMVSTIRNSYDFALTHADDVSSLVICGGVTTGTAARIDLRGASFAGVPGGIIISATNTAGTGIAPALQIDKGDTPSITVFGIISLFPGKTVDGRDVSVDGAKLDLIEASADVTDFTNVQAALGAATGTVAFNSQSITGVDRISLTVTASDVSNPPTDAELDALWTGPATVGAGWCALLQDSAGTDTLYQIVSDGSAWWVFTGVKAV